MILNRNLIPWTRVFFPLHDRETSNIYILKDLWSWIEYFRKCRQPTVWFTINWKILKQMRIPDHLTCLLRNMYAGQEATVRTSHGTTAWFQIGKGVHQGCTLLPCLFNLYAEYIMWNAGLDEEQAGIKISGRNINSFIYADDTTLMTESEEELKSFLMKVKEESEKVGLKFNSQKKLRSWHLVPSLHGK